jgi:NTP pyrophosphatase (non-canonical NTP hydrolase)
MSAQHKKALAEGRELSRTVKAYLEALDAQTPKKRGRRRTPESIEKRLAAIQQELAEATPLNRLTLTQEQLDLEDELAQLQGVDDADLPELEKAFIKVAKDYSERKGISYTAWRANGVEASVLKAAGIPRS